VRPSGNSIRNDPIDSNDGEQQRNRGKTKNGGPVEFRPGERVKHPLLHGFYAEHRNLRVHRSDRVANHSEPVFRASIDAPSDWRPETVKTAWDTVFLAECGANADLKHLGGSVSDGASDAAWLDTYWRDYSYPKVKVSVYSKSNQNTNHRFQTQGGKHNATVNIVYADGHAKSSRPSRLTWGNFYGIFDATHKEQGVASTDPVASPDMDAQQSTVP